MKSNIVYIFLLCICSCCSHYACGSEHNQVPDLSREKRFLAYEGGPGCVNKDDWQKLEQARKERENIIKYYLHKHSMNKDNNSISHQNCGFGKK